MAKSIRTHDHDEIRRWIEERKGRPSVVKSTHEKGEGGILRIDFGKQEDSLEEVPWEEFFSTFDERNLDFLCQDDKDSRFFKFVEREQT